MDLWSVGGGIMQPCSRLILQTVLKFDFRILVVFAVYIC